MYIRWKYVSNHVQRVLDIDFYCIFINNFLCHSRVRWIKQAFNQSSFLFKLFFSIVRAFDLKYFFRSIGNVPRSRTFFPRIVPGTNSTLSFLSGRLIAFCRISFNIFFRLKFDVAVFSQLYKHRRLAGKLES